MKKVDFVVRGMSCNHCKMAVEKEVSKVAGVKSVTAFPKEEKVTVEFDGPDSTVVIIKAAIDDAGYEVEGYSSEK